MLITNAYNIKKIGLLNNERMQKDSRLTLYFCRKNGIKRMNFEAIRLQNLSNIRYIQGVFCRGALKFLAFH